MPVGVFFDEDYHETEKTSKENQWNRTTIHITVKQNKVSKQYSPETAYTLLQEKLIIIVENATSNRAFLEALQKAFK